MSKAIDVAIVGGGIMGSATAYYLRKHGFTGKIAIFEKDTTYAYSCTARAVGGIRQQFSCPENIRMSQFGLRLVRNLEAEFGQGADVGFREQGYLVLASSEGEAALRSNVALQKSLGAGSIVFGPAELTGKFPWLSVGGISAGAYGARDEGWLDPSTLMTLFRKAAQREGVILVNEEVVHLDHSDKQISRLHLKSGDRVELGLLVNTAGAGAGVLASMAGISLPVEPRKRYVYVFDCPLADESIQRAPLVFDPSGFYFRPEGRNFIAGLSPAPSDEPAVLDWEVDYSWFDERIWPNLAARVPLFETIKVVNAWVGHYDFNSFDENGIIGRHPEISNLYFANGFSGHGVQQGPAAGNAIAELIVHNRYIAIDLTNMGYERITRAEPYRETNVI